MSTSNYKYELYGMPAAQPSRAVIWLAALTNFEYELKPLSPSEAATNEEYHANVNPFGTVPALLIKNAQTGEKVGAILDSLAIASYICDVTGEKGEAFIPKKDPLLRAKVIQTAVYGMTVNRNVTNEIVGPLVVAFFAKQTTSPFTSKQIEDFLYPKFEGQIVDLFRAQGSLKNGKDGAKDTECPNVTCPFLVPEAGRITFADIACFVETYQLDLLGLNDQVYANRPCYKRWTDAMKQVPHFDKVHEAAVGFFKALVPLLPKKE